VALILLLCSDNVGLVAQMASGPLETYHTSHT